MTMPAKNKRETQAETEIRRNALSSSFAGVQVRLERKGVSSAFVRAAKPDLLGDMGFMGSLVFNAIIGGPLAGFVLAHVPLSAHHGLVSHFNGTMASGIYEGVSALQDIAAERKSRLRDDPSPLYPQGRRKAVIIGKKMKRGFNRLAANQNGRFSYDVQMDLAEMFRIADMLDGIPKTSGMEDILQERVSDNITPTRVEMPRKNGARGLRIAV